MTIRHLIPLRALTGAVVLAAGLVLPLTAQQVRRVSVSPSSVRLEAGGREAVLVTAYDARDNVVPLDEFTWNSEDPSVARVEVDPAAPNIAYIIGVGGGSTTVTARVGNVGGRVAVEVLAATGPMGSGAAASLQLRPSPLALLPAEERALESVFLRADGQLAGRQPLQWSSLRGEVATVDSRGRVTGITGGQGVIQARSASGLSARVVVRVSNDSIAFNRTGLSLGPAESDSLIVLIPRQANRRINAGQLQWGTTNPNVVLVSQSGEVTGVSEGRAEVAASGFGQQARLEVVVHREVRAMEINPKRDEPVVVPLRGSVPFTLEFFDAQNRLVPEARVAWEVGDPNRLAVDPATNRVTGLQMGRSTVTVRGPSGLEVTWDVEVVGGGVALAQNRVALSPRGSWTASASFTDRAGNILAPATGLTWTSSDPAVATVNAQGIVTSRAWGHARIVASTSWGDADSADVYVQGGLLVTRFPAGAGDIYALDPERPHELNQVTNDPQAAEITPVYSPDGTEIAYVTSADAVARVYVMNADGSGARVLNEAGGPEQTPTWTPDGRQILYTSEGDVWIVNRDGTGARRLTDTPSRESTPVVSPDGRQVAFVATRGANLDIHFMDINGENRQAMEETEASESYPRWLADGRLMYIVEEGRRNRTRRVVRRILGTRAVEPVTSDTLRAENFDVSPDGSLMALTVQVQNRGQLMNYLYLVPLTGANAGQFTPVPPADESDQFFFPALRRP